MPKLSKNTAPTIEDHGVVVDRRGVLEDTSVSFVSFAEDIDGAPLLKGLPDDQCPCPHWGYVLSGSVSFTYSHGTEVYDAGDAFYVPPGHTPAASADSEMLLFSPADQIAEVEAVMSRNMQRELGADQI